MSSAYAPGATQLASELHVSETVSLLGVSLFCIGLSLGPIIAAPLSETFGRLIIYRFSLPISALFIIGSAVADDMASIAVCRFFAGAFGSPALSVGGGTIADIWRAEMFGPATGAFLLAPFLGPSIGMSNLLSFFSF
jgi:MFS family permease